MMNTQNMEQKLRDAGMRPTRQRMSLGKLLFGSGDRHITAEQLHVETVQAGVFARLKRSSSRSGDTRSLEGQEFWLVLSHNVSICYENNSNTGCAGWLPAPPNQGLRAMSERKGHFGYEELLACGRGELFGPGNAQLPLPPMLMFDRITSITDDGGSAGKGQIVAELDIKPDLWFFPCHFQGQTIHPCHTPAVPRS